MDGAGEQIEVSNRSWLTGSTRRLLVAGAVDWLGTGLLVAASAVYFTQVVGIPTRQVGLGLTLAGVLAMSAAGLVGMLADRFGVKRVLIGLYLVRAGATFAYMAVTGWLGLVGAAVFRLLGDQATSPLVQSLVAEVTEDGNTRVRIMASYRVVANVATAVSTPLAGYAIAIGTYQAFAFLLIGNAFAFVATAVLLMWMPAGVRRRSRPTATPKAAVIRDGTLLSLTGVDGLLALWQPVLSIAMPLWIVASTDAPKFMAGVLFALNTIGCIVCQVSAARLTSRIRLATRSYTAVPLLLLASCGFFAASGSSHGGATIALLVAAVVTLTGAELLQTSASWTLSYAIAPDEKRSQYLSVFGLGRAASRNLIGPLVLTTVVTMPHAQGWFLLALGFLLVTGVTYVVGRKCTQVPSRA
ncbi:MFS transporter [Longimycelium tulufanense]|uniref:MFS transporter n=1 Tax=Longimycelium tulufanense TaxID=907463 RepID=UPI001663BA81|nr:MFS transporter [Longimycelium tulufanense]